MAFQPGISGNPAGRPKGIVDRRAQIRLALEERAEEIICLALDRAKSGSDAVLVALINRLIPSLRPDSLVQLNLGSDAPVHVRWLSSERDDDKDATAINSASTG